MINCIVIDDDENVTKVIEYYIKEYEPSLNLIGKAHDFKSGVELIKKNSPQIVFLDIQIYDKTGFDVLEYIDIENSFVVFITAHQEYALEAYKKGVLGYLLKPIDPDEFTEVVSRIKKIIFPKISNKTVIKTKQSNHILNNKDLYLIVSKGKNRCEFKTINDNIIIKKSIGDIEKALINSNFFKINQSTILNLSFIKNIDINTREIFLRNNETVKVSHRKKKLLLDIMNSF